MLLAFIIAFFPHNVQFQAFDGVIWTGFDAGPAHIEGDNFGAVAVWNLWSNNGDPVFMTDAYSLIMKD